MSGRRRDIMDIRELLRHIRAFRDTWELGIHSYLTYLRPALLVLDDFGLKPLQPPAPEDLYDIINERYEQGSIALTSNRAPENGPIYLGTPSWPRRVWIDWHIMQRSWSSPGPAFEFKAADD